ncbi:MAG: membrane protein insertion efficiency factor YidD [Deltaproteobacteria bacterium]|nr:membrane protein insertion efficiency factor YidD [Deltaproteobacteria bacterium]
MKILRAVHKLYSRFVSPLLGNRCRFHPSCSHYAVQAIEDHGWLRGCYLAAKRLLRCQPWCEGGFDPVPPRDEAKRASIGAEARN